MTTTTRNPMGFFCAPNQSTPDYITYHDLRDFTAYGLIACWLGSTATDPDEDCNFNRPVTAEDVTELRGHLLDTMENIIGGLWNKDLTPGQGEIDCDCQSHVIDKEDGNDPAVLTWRARLDDEVIMLEFDAAGDQTAYWLAYDAITDRKNTVKVLAEARQHAPAYNNTVWHKLIELARLPDDPIELADDE